MLLERENAEQVLFLKETILQAMDSLSLAMAFYDGQEEKVMFNLSFGKFIGGKEKGGGISMGSTAFGRMVEKGRKFTSNRVGSLKLCLRIWGREKQ
jgi:hypothetical protein